MPKRCALGCSYNAMISYHQFPHPERNPDRFKAWVYLCGGKLDTQDEYEVYRKKVVCDIHFTDKDRNRNNRLSFLAVPSLHLHGVTSIESMIGTLHTLEPVCNEPSTSKLIETVAGKSDKFDTSEKVLLASESGNNKSLSTLKSIVTGKYDEIDTLQKILLPPESVDEERLTTLIPIVTENCAGVILPSLLSSSAYNHTTAGHRPSHMGNITWGVISSEHNYCKLGKKKAMKGKKTKRHQQSMPSSLLLNQLNTTRSKIKILQSKLVRSQRKNKTFESRLADAEKKITTDDLLKKLTNQMTVAAKIFTKMQYTQTSKKPSGRRFSLEEKVLSLSLFKKSPRSYPLLAKFFTLPSAKSLKRLLSKVEVESGLNKSIFLKMKNTVKELSTEDRLCSLIFDEMSICPQIHYNAAKDQLRGFTFDGKKFADHVLVFMVKGLRKKFKQPIAYYFTNSLNKTQLKDMLKKVVNYVRSSGLNIVCTVCDQSTVNVSVINELLKDTRIKYLKEGKEWINDIIEKGKSKIIPLFDVPHLLKGIRNNLLSKDLKYYDFEEKCEKTVKWEYYKQVYEADKCYGELKILQKLTDEHVYVDKIKKMKVKAAAQIFSHSVAVATEHLSARGDLPEECRNLIKITKLIDNLFDSLNSNILMYLTVKCIKDVYEESLLTMICGRML